MTLFKGKTFHIHSVTFHKKHKKFENDSLNIWVRAWLLKTFIATGVPVSYGGVRKTSSVAEDD